MCKLCYTDDIRAKVYAAGRIAGSNGDYCEPLPIGSPLREDFERGLRDGLGTITKDNAKLKSKRTVKFSR